MPAASCVRLTGRFRTPARSRDASPEEVSSVCTKAQGQHVFSKLPSRPTEVSLPGPLPCTELQPFLVVTLSPSESHKLCDRVPRDGV